MTETQTKREEDGQASKQSDCRDLRLVRFLGSLCTVIAIFHKASIRSTLQINKLLFSNKLLL